MSNLVKTVVCVSLIIVVICGGLLLLHYDPCNEISGACLFTPKNETQCEVSPLIATGDGTVSLSNVHFRVDCNYVNSTVAPCYIYPTRIESTCDDTYYFATLYTLMFIIDGLFFIVTIILN